MSGYAIWNFQIPASAHLAPSCPKYQTTFITDNRFFDSYDVTDNKTSDLFFKPVCYTMNDIYHREDERLKTFENWPLSWLDKKQLAKTGMFYTGDEDKVKCYFCEVEIGRWEHEDLPVNEHLRWSPNCPLLRRRTTNNMPIDNEELNQILPPISYDICGANDAIENRSGGGGGVGGALSSPRPSNNLNCSNNNNNATYYPEFPEYAIETARVRSFSEWPRHMKQTPEQMADAGFFYSGVGDRVKCFSCGGGLKDWDDNDEPWEQHALWLPKCRFVKLMKGQSFIDAAIAKHKDAAAAEGTSEVVVELANAPVRNSNEILLNEGKEKPTCSAKIIDTKTATTATTTATMSIARLPTTEAESLNEMATTTTIAAAAAVAVGSAATETTNENEENYTTNEANESARSVDSLAQKAKGHGIYCDKMSTCVEAEKRAPTFSSSIPEEKLCKICYANEYNTAFLPCGHVVACAKCASSVTKCPMCRKPFTDAMRVYFS